MTTERIREETSGDIAAISLVHRLAFGGDDEATLVDQLRMGGHCRVSLVAEVSATVVGHILFSPIVIESADHRRISLALAPLAVIPQFQNQGIGDRLVREGIRHCKRKGFDSVFVLGHSAYYPRFGFSVELAQRFDSPYAGPHFMALELVPGALSEVTGKLVYAPPFSA